MPSEEAVLLIEGDILLRHPLAEYLRNAVLLCMRPQTVRK